MINLSKVERLKTYLKLVQVNLSWVRGSTYWNEIDEEGEVKVTFLRTR